MSACSAGGTGGSADVGDAIDPASMDDAPADTITWCAQKDSSGAFTAIVDAFNAEFEADGHTLELLEFPESTDEWRNQFVQRQEAKSDECDIFGADVVWTAEFANKGYLYDLTPYVETRADEFIPSTFSTTEYDGKNWAVPFGTNVGFLFWRTDRVSEGPATWQNAYADAQQAGGILYQGSAYEGLTVNFLEIANAAGGEVLSEDGMSSAIDSPENLAALQFMVDGIEDGAAPRDVLTFTEEESRRAWEAGQAGLLRNWTYAYVLGKQNPEIADSFEIEPLPPFDGGTGDGSGILGGVNMVVSKYSANPGAALKAVDFITSAEGQTLAALKGQAATLSDVYDDPAVQQALPFWETLERGIEQATSRPVTPVYSLVSQAIYENVNRALSGQLTPEEALEQADSDINDALNTF
ncbi:ABC transporter substrate-binding protein [Microbacterium sp. NPDC078428]|uniref:ABC transporter substrate-binding protein n=1 Tax=Microbacterium sp. NPDC078428 TaxID=3364190 RepID=UPI0037CCAA16